MKLLYAKKFSKDLECIENNTKLKERLLDLIEQMKQAGSLYEIDTVRKIQGYENYYRLIQSAASMEDKKTAAREVNALSEAMDECGVTKATIVTFNTEEHIETNQGLIHILPAWKWALNPDQTLDPEPRTLNLEH